MSLVVYNNDSNDLKVVLHDPSREAMIVHDTASNKFQLVKTNLAFDGATNELARFQGIEVHKPEDFLCPHCGSTFRQNGAGQTPITPEPDVDPVVEKDGQVSYGRRKSNVFNNRYNRNYKYMNNNYFKLLALSSNFDEENPTDQVHLLGGDARLLKDLVVYGAQKFAAITDDPAIRGPTIESKYEELPSNLFTQDYFAKFFKIDKMLGRGSNAVVYKVEHFINNFSLGFFAVKKIPIGNDTRGLTRILKEVELLCLLSTSNKNLVKYNHVWLEIDQVTSFGPKIPCAFILTEYCDGGNLEDLVNELKTPKDDVESRKRKFKERKKKRQSEGNLDYSDGSRLLNQIEILKFFKDITTGVYELHLNHIIHRDLKPSNCLLSTRYDEALLPNESVYDEAKYRQYVALPSILVSDFGESQFEGKMRSSTGATGTLEFTAPELLLPSKDSNTHCLNNFTKHTDMFGLGMILFFMCFGKLPYEFVDMDLDLDYSMLKSQIKGFDMAKFVQTEMFSKRYYRQDLCDEIYDLLKCLLHKDPIQRILTPDVLKILNGLINRELYNPLSRTSSNTTYLSRQLLIATELHSVEEAEEEREPKDPDLGYEEEVAELMLEDREQHTAIKEQFEGLSAFFAKSWACFLLSKIVFFLFELKCAQYCMVKYYKFQNSSHSLEPGAIDMDFAAFCNNGKLLLFNMLMLGISIPTANFYGNIGVLLVVVCTNIVALIFKDWQV